MKKLWNRLKRLWFKYLGLPDTRLLLRVEDWLLANPDTEVDYVVVSELWYDNILAMYPWWDPALRLGSDDRLYIVAYFELAGKTSLLQTKLVTQHGASGVQVRSKPKLTEVGGE